MILTTKKNTVLCALVWLIPVISIMSVYVMHMISMQYGWGLLYAQRMAEGAVPYKDFYYMGPPLTLQISYAFYKIFGNHFWPFVIFGCLLRILGFMFFYYLLLQIYTPIISAFATLISAVAYIEWIFVGPEISMNDISFLCGYIVPVLFIRFLDDIEQVRILYKKIFIIGILCGISLINKQSFGLTIILTSLIVLNFIIIKHNKCKLIINYNINFIFGISILLIIQAVYLIYIDSFIIFLKNAFIDAPSAKSDLKTIFFFIIDSLGNPKYMKPLFITLLILLFVFIYNKYNNTKYENVYLFSPLLWIIFIEISIIIGYMLVYICLLDETKTLIYVNESFIKFGSVAQTFIIVSTWYYFCDWIFGYKSIIKAKYAILYCFIFSLTYGCQLSLGLPNIPFFNFGLFISFLLAWSIRYNSIKNIICYLFVVVCVFAISLAKFGSPCYWNSWKSGSVTENLIPSSLSSLQGFTLPENEVNTFEEIYNLVNYYTEKNDSIFVYNNLQAFYIILDRPALTSNFSHYWDVCPDRLAINDARTLKYKKPKFILYLQYPLYSIQFQEYIFRSGRISGQRQIDEAIVEMIEDNTYTIKKIYYNTTSQDIYTRRSLYAKYIDHFTGTHHDIKMLSSLPNGYVLYALIRKDIDTER